MAIRVVKVEEATEEQRARCIAGAVCPWCRGGKFWRQVLCSRCAAGRAPIYVACWLESLDPAYYLRRIAGKGLTIYVPDSRHDRWDTDLPQETVEAAATAEAPRESEPPVQAPQSPPASAPDAPAGGVADPPAATADPPARRERPLREGAWQTIWSEHDPDPWWG